MKYVLIMIMSLAYSYSIGQGVDLYDGIKSGKYDASGLKNKVYQVGGSDFLISLYDQDSTGVYGLALRSVENFDGASLEKRDNLLFSVRDEFIKIYGAPSLNNESDYLPFMLYNQTYTIYGWQSGEKIIFLSLFGRKDLFNIIKIEIFDKNLI